MIQSNELMGNYFIGYDNEIFKWDLLHFDLMITQKLSIDEIIKSPIVINENWLVEKFGFVEGHKCEDYHNFVLLDPFYIVVLKENNFHLHIHGKLNINVQYVHELQNLFFALAKQELKLIKSESTI